MPEPGSGGTAMYEEASCVADLCLLETICRVALVVDDATELKWSARSSLSHHSSGFFSSIKSSFKSRSWLVYVQG